MSKLRKKSILYKLVVSSEQIVDDLISWNVLPNKTHKTRAHKDLEDNPDFWRGVIDGDGSTRFNRNNDPVIQLYGSKTLLQQFNQFVKSIIKKSNVIVNKNGEGRTHGLKLNGKMYWPLVEELKGKPCLERKWKKF